ncbi:hypothetical protein ABZ761_42225, partial [Kitasatospora sp. NPDC006786]|uniref:hypothetical protein n=1 Tax=Kitasatospora sp. NPDC006786 TaxID=3157187 RepID=UPI003401D30F
MRIAAAKADAAARIPFPSKHHEQDHHMNPAAVDPTARAEQATERQTQNRILEMQLLHESLARAHMQDRLHEAENQRLVTSPRCSPASARAPTSRSARWWPGAPTRRWTSW